jgi:hypothetical protein
MKFFRLHVFFKETVVLWLEGRMFEIIVFVADVTFTSLTTSGENIYIISDVHIST